MGFLEDLLGGILKTVTPGQQGQPDMQRNGWMGREQQQQNQQQSSGNGDPTKMGEQRHTDMQRNAQMGGEQQQMQHGGHEDLSTMATKLYEQTGKMINDAGGLPGLVEKFQQTGQGPAIVGWIGTGANPKISPEDTVEACGPDRMKEMSQKTHLPLNQLAEALSKLLPKLVDKMTPNGNVAAKQNVEQSMNSIKSDFLG